MIIAAFPSLFFSVTKTFELFDLVYIIPPFRFSVYAVGMFLGLSLRKFKDTKLSKWALHFGWGLATLCMIAVIWISISSQAYTPLTAACFSALAPIAICVFFAWMIFSAQLGHKSKKFNYYLNLNFK